MIIREKSTTRTSHKRRSGRTRL